MGDEADDRRRGGLTVAARLRLVTAGVAAVVATGLGALVRHRTVSDRELELFQWFNSWPVVLAAPMWAVMQVGSVWGGLVVAVGGMAFLHGRRGIPAGAVTVLAAWAMARLLKEWVERGRPADYLGDVDSRWESLPHGLGYPSGHAAVAFAVATLLAGSLARPWARVAYALAAVVAIARLVFGAHLPLDVVGGAAVGIAVGQLCRFLVPDDPATSGRPT
jgi:undecaprenyl-diphosphatase